MPPAKRPYRARQHGVTRAAAIGRRIEVPLALDEDPGRAVTWGIPVSEVGRITRAMLAARDQAAIREDEPETTSDSRPVITAAQAGTIVRMYVSDELKIQEISAKLDNVPPRAVRDILVASGVKLRTRPTKALIKDPPG